MSITHTDTPAADMLRWRPSAETIAHARRLMDACDVIGAVLIPLVQPGKTYGWWEIGQLVETVPICLPETPGLDHVTARNAAWLLASQTLGDRAGTTAYALIERRDLSRLDDPSFVIPVFEDVL